MRVGAVPAALLIWGVGCITKVAPVEVDDDDQSDAVASGDESAVTLPDGACLGHEGCAEGELCAFSLGVCGMAPGLCVPFDPALACAPLDSPVCGCGNVTYVNGCEAWRFGVSVAHEGACQGGSTAPPASDEPPPAPGSCGGVMCGQGEFCQYPNGTCGSSGPASGTCRSTEGLCTGSIYAACGCDGATYETPCAALKAGISVDHLGPC